MVEEFIPIAFFMVIVLIVFVIAYFKFKTRSAYQETIRLALEKGSELSPELLDQLAGPKRPKASDLRRGSVALAIGAAFALFGFILGEEEAVRPMIAVGMFPAMMGIAYLVLWKTRDRTDSGQ